MSAFGAHLRYSQWDGPQQSAALDADSVLSAMSDDLLNHGNLRAALRSLMRRGMSGNAPMQGVHELIRELRREQRQKMERYDLSSIMKGIEEHLDEVLRLERDALKEMGTPREIADPESDPESGPESDPDLDQGASTETGDASPDAAAPSASTPNADGSPPPEGSGNESGEPSFAHSLMSNLAQTGLDFLDALPDDAPGKVSALQEYDFTSPDAQRKFEELLEQLREAMTQTFFKDVEKMIQDMSDGDIQRMKDMVDDLNDMLVKQIGGEDPNFDDFMSKYGDMFGPNPPSSLDELIEQLQSQMAAMQSLMMSMPTSQFEQLQSLLQDRLGDAGLESSMRSLAQKLDFLDPRKGGRFRFSGDQEIDLKAAMEMMEQMHQMARLEDQLNGVLRDGDIDQVDAEKLEQLLGPEAKDSLEQMKQLLEILEKAGYVKRDGDDMNLTPRGTRMIG
ncbi:MAG: hypothetical protein AAF493_25185, partial [Pseudomonadota bacterium]